MSSKRFSSEYQAKKFAEKVNGQVVPESLESMGLWECTPRFYDVYYDEDEN